MRRAKSNFPIGATWQLRDNNGKLIAEISLDEVRPQFEIWRYWYESFTRNNGDWATSYKQCRSQIPKDGKFKRVK